MAEPVPRIPDRAPPTDKQADDAHAEYTHRLRSARNSISACERKHVAIGNARLAIFVMAIVIAWLAFLRHQASGQWLILPFVAFVIAMFLHSKVLRKRSLVEKRANYYERGLARVEERWKGSGTGRNYLAPASHSYAEDLDLLGDGGLFELLSTARTRLGEDRLAGWLLSPSPIATLKERHAAIRELQKMLDFRECLAIAGREAVTQKQTDPLWNWGQSQTLAVRAWMRWIALALSITMAFAILWFAIGDFMWLGGAAEHPPLNALRLLIAAALFNGSFALLWRHGTLRAVEEFESIRTGLALLTDLLLQIERAKFSSKPLVHLQAEVGREIRASSQLRRLTRFSDLLDSRDNLFVRIFGPPLLWTTQVTFAIEHWRARYGQTGRAWVEAVAEMEALSSLATYAYEHHDDPFPEFEEVESGVYDGRALAHPLIPNCVRNSVSLSAAQPLLIVSGSNMSGKSTLLRTIGVNSVLAFAGAPVRAESLRVSPLRIGASLHISDSLALGDSHFSAEIKRIRTIVDLAENQGPALFLIDEILQGTNSRDRLTGTQAILDRLLLHGAIGLITTHDLALTRLGGVTGSRATNVHFQDEIRNGLMAFDYRLKPGVVEGSNAVELMRLYGLINPGDPVPYSPGA